VGREREFSGRAFGEVKRSDTEGTEKKAEKNLRKIEALYRSSAEKGEERSFAVLR
jgi:hypothetical protein